MKSGLLRVTIQVLVLCVTAPFLNGQSASAPFDPITMDPPVRDTVNPPSMVELAFESAGQRLNGLMYVASGPGPHPTVILLHGHPGNERNLDLAQAIRRSGTNVLYFNYRGSWGSGGFFSRSNALEDVAAALRYVRSREAIVRYRADPGRVALVGHSMGGWLALMGTVADADVACVAGLDFSNTGATGRRLQVDREAESSTAATLKGLTAPGGPYRAKSVAGLVTELKVHADAWDVTRYGGQLSTRPVLLISAVIKSDQDALASALSKADAQRLTALAWTTDHSFSDRRIELARAVVGWLHSGCGF